MVKLFLITILLGVLAVGCGVNKEYVEEQIAASESRLDAKIGAVSDKTDGNAAEIAKLRQLGEELSQKTDMAINQAAGFENYQVIWEGEINFDYDSYEVDDVAGQILNEAGLKMESNPKSVIEIAGHTDQSGSNKYNLLLGEKRAEAAKRFLSERFGISLYRMFTISYGEDKPVALPDQQYANSKNRRVNLRVWGVLSGK